MNGQPMLKRNHEEKFTPHIDRKICIACTMCVEACPAGALTLEVKNGPAGFRRYPSHDRNGRCVGCRACEQICLSEAIRIR